jgi:hypothetical protein
MSTCSYAGALFAESCLKGLNGAQDIVECSYVASTVVPGLPYFSSKVCYVTIITSLLLGFSMLTYFFTLAIENW